MHHCTIIFKHIPFPLHYVTNITIILYLGLNYSIRQNSVVESLHFEPTYSDLLIYIGCNTCGKRIFFRNNVPYSCSNCFKESLFMPRYASPYINSHRCFEKKKKMTIPLYS